MRRDLMKVFKFLLLFWLLLPATAVAAAPSGSSQLEGSDTSRNEKKEEINLNLDEKLFGKSGQINEAARYNLTTPRGTLKNLFFSAGAKEYEQAAKSLDLRDIENKEMGPELAGKLRYVLSNRLDLKYEILPNSPKGLTKQEIEKGHPLRRTILLAEFTIEKNKFPIELVRIDRDEKKIWVFSGETVNGIEKLFRHTGVGRFTFMIPFHLLEYDILGISLFRIALMFIAILISWFLAGIFRRYIFFTASRLIRQNKSLWNQNFWTFLSKSCLALLFFSLLWLASKLLIGLPPRWSDLYNKLLFFGIVGSMTWFLIRSITMVASVKGAVRLQQLEDKDVFLARSFNTQLTVLRRSVNVIVFAIGMSIALSAFDWFSSIGMSLLASAGLLGIIIGIGAQRSLANIFAGLQLALTQPVRIGDMVVFEGEWGYIEDITYTYVVLRIWDLRRMIVPTTKIIDEALYNFSRGELTLYGTVYLYLDYSMPIEIIRERLKEIVAGDENHDGNIASVLVTDCRDWVMEVRVLVSAHDGLSAWYLRCKVREQLIAFLQEYEGGRYLPRSRVVMEQDKDFGKAESASYDQQTGKQMKSEEEEKGVGSRDDSEAPVDENKEE